MNLKKLIRAAVVVILVCLVFRNQRAHADGYPALSSHYVGVLKHDALGKEQLAKLDLIGDLSATQGSVIGILTLQFGDFSNFEYVNYHFNRVQLGSGKKLLRLEQDDQNVSVDLEEDAQGILRGKLISLSRGPVGAITLDPNGVARPTLPLIQALNGEYRGFCRDRQQVLRLYTYKSIQDTSRIANPFGSFEVAGEWGEEIGDLAFPGDLSTGAPVVSFSIEHAVYNFFGGDIHFDGHPGGLECNVNGDEISCEGCTVKRVTNVAPQPSYSQSIGGEFWNHSKRSPFASDPHEIQGEYRGYVHHELLDVYQELSIHFNNYSDDEGASKTKLSAVAFLSFGNAGQGETLSYRFPQIELSQQGPLTLHNLEKHEDPIIYITGISSETVEGIWYSKSFGRVGAFQLLRSGLPKLPEGKHKMASVEGRFSGGMWDLQLHADPERSPTKTANPFFPIDFGGYLRINNLSEKIGITGGSYDFYSGKIGFLTEDGRSVVGTRETDGRLKLNILSQGFDCRMTDYEPVLFKRD